MIKTLLLFSFTLLTSDVHAFFRINCAKTIVGRIDPIVNPGALAQHAHTISGGSNVGVNATYASLLRSQCTTCEVMPDKSAYWTPNLYYQRPNGSFEEIYHDGSVVYYLGRGKTQDGTSKAVPFPKGFKMVAGNKSNRRYNATGMTWGNQTYPARPISDAVSFACLSANGVPETPNLVNVSSCINGLRAQVHFQTCWDGKSLYKTDNSHVAWLSGIDNGVCPPNYPVLLPHLFMETSYAVRLTKNTDDGGRFVLSMGDPTGYGFHGDFLNGWDMTVQKQAVEKCLGPEGFGTIPECPVLWLNDQAQARWNCPERNSTILEPTRGMIDKLPGCIRITEGPESATAADMECPAGVQRAQIVSTVDSTPVPTLNPRIGENYGYQFNKYVGCGNDSTNSPLRTLNAVMTSSPGMTIEMCQKYCNTRGYKYSGLEFGQQCACDLAINPTAMFYQGLNMSTGCSMLCAGDKTQICGGPAYMNVWENTDPDFRSTNDTTNSVYQLTIPLKPFPDNYVGCFAEPQSGRALAAASTSSSNMTAESCMAYCSGYKLFGLEFRSQCFCSNTLAPASSQVDQSQCNMRCVGDYGQLCGGASRISVYNNTAYRPILTQQQSGPYTSLGCIADGGTLGRTLQGARLVASDMTVDKCTAFCSSKGMKYCGMEYATECYASNQIDTAAAMIDCSSKQHMTCGGDKYTYCGGPNMMELYYAGTL